MKTVFCPEVDTVSAHWVPELPGDWVRAPSDFVVSSNMVICHHAVCYIQRYKYVIILRYTVL